MSKVVSLDGRAPLVDRDPEIVRVLEELLDDANAGRLEGIAIAAVSKDGSIRCVWKGATKSTTMLGTIRRLEFDMLLAILENEQ
jgi:hypothetical protein